MTCTEKKRLNGKTTSRSNRPAHETSESIYSKFQIEMNAKNERISLILGVHSFLWPPFGVHRVLTRLFRRM